MTTGWVRRWGPFMGALACLAILGVVDTALKRAPVAGYCPGTTQWFLCAENVSRFCSSFARTQPGKGVPKAFGDFMSEYQRDVRLNLGIRPTILRWHVWMGNYLLIASAPEGIGASVRPGVLLRVVDQIRRLRNGPPEEGIAKYGQWFYAWNHGFLIFSSSRPYVKAALAGQPVTHSSPRNAILLRHLAEDGFNMTIRATAGIPVSGNIRWKGQRGKLPLTLPDSGSSSPLLSLTVRKPVELYRCARTVTPWVQSHSQPFADYCTTLWKHWDVPKLEDGWDNGIAESALALLDVDTEPTVPLPVLSCVFRGEESPQGKHPLEVITANSPAYPAEWNGEPGWRIPWLGQGLTLCLGRSARDWLVASREPAMAQLAADIHEGPSVDADMAFRLDWSKTARMLSRLVPRLAEWGVWPNTSQRDVDRRLSPISDFLATLGKISINGRYNEDVMVFDGSLVAGKTD